MKRLDVRSFTSAQAQAVFGAVSLVALLVYTFTHTGALLARYVQPDLVGYICAFGVELAVVSLSLRIGDLRRSGQNARLFVGVLIAVLVVSALANIAEGYAAMYNGRLLKLSGLADLDKLQALFGLSATGLISVIVFALSDIIGSDVRRAAAPEQAAQPAPPEPVQPVHLHTRRRAFARTPAAPPVPPVEQPVHAASIPVQAVPVQPRLSVAERRQAVRDLYAELGSDWSLSKAAACFNVARSTIDADLKALRLNGHARP